MSRQEHALADIHAAYIAQEIDADTMEKQVEEALATDWPEGECVVTVPVDGEPFHVYATDGYMPRFEVDDHGWPSVNGKRVTKKAVKRGWVQA